MVHQIHKKGELLELADRCESAGLGQSRELLMELRRTLRGDPLVLLARNDIGSGNSDLRHLIAAEAWENAALTFKPANWFLADWSERAAGEVHCTLKRGRAQVTGRAETLALALLAAICRAEAHDQSC